MPRAGQIGLKVVELSPNDTYLTRFIDQFSVQGQETDSKIVKFVFSVPNLTPQTERMPVRHVSLGTFCLSFVREILKKYSSRNLATNQKIVV